jgi:hypothetical protein
LDQQRTVGGFEMNTLSWLLYLTDVVGSITTLLILIGVPAVAICGYAWVSCLVDEEDAPCLIRRWFWAGAIMLLLAAVIPSPRTLYAIAASELGEAAVQELTPTAEKSLKVLNKWLDEQLAEEPQK